MTNKFESPKRRPLGVWLVFAFYVLAVIWTLLSFTLIFGGAITVAPEQKAYFESLTAFDWILSLAIGVIGVSAAVCLFLLRRVAIVLLSVALALNVAAIAVGIFWSNWAESLSSAGLVGALLGLVIDVAVILYAHRLAMREVLS